MNTSASPAESAEVLAFLRSPEAYGEAGPVELRETHISWVFLTAQHAYKLKKPVRFEFLDFSTPEFRHAACAEELRLNRRLAPQVYVDLMPLVRTATGELALGGDGETLDWLVKMRRLPDERMLDTSLSAGRVTAADIDRVARDLLPFYARAPKARLNGEEYRARIEHHVRANLADLSRAEFQLDSATVRRIHGRQLRFLKIQSRMFDERVRAGRVVDGHGDLRPEHVCLTEPTAIFDCLEFSAELREIDVADELSFLAMECHLLAADWVGRQLVSLYETASGDHPPPALWSFYQSYRACVRAKVSALRSRQLAEAAKAEAIAAAGQYLRLADELSQPLPAPPVIIVRGLSGTGKSTLARELAAALGVEHLSTDAIRRELLGESASPAGLNAGIYAPESRDRVYEAMLQRAGEFLNQGLAVILDGTFLSAATRSAAMALAQRHRSTVLVVNCRCSRDIARARIQDRLAAAGDASEARPELYDEQAAREEADPPGITALAVDTSLPLSSQALAVFTALDRLIRRHHQLEGDLVDPHGAAELPTADEALARLIAGNERFRAGQSRSLAYSPVELAELTKGQQPFVTVLGCSDSRVPPEWIFDAGLGELFVIRVAGNVFSAEIAGSLQYAGQHLQTPLFVVLGHEGCGAVAAALATKQESAEHHRYIQALVNSIVPALDDINLEEDSAARLTRAVEANVKHTIGQIVSTPEGQTRVAEGRMKIVGAVYELATGRVRFL